MNQLTSKIPRALLGLTFAVLFFYIIVQLSLFWLERDISQQLSHHLELETELPPNLFGNKRYAPTRLTLPDSNTINNYIFQFNMLSSSHNIYNNKMLSIFSLLEVKIISIDGISIKKSSNICISRPLQLTFCVISKTEIKKSSSNRDVFYQYKIKLNKLFLFGFVFINMCLFYLFVFRIIPV